MPARISRLRRGFALAAIALCVVVAGMYFYARIWRVRNVLKEVPGKIDISLQQTAKGFKFSKSEQGRTIFTVEAGELKQFKLNGRAELHNVNIILYGRDSSRFDQIYGDDFEYDPQSGEITARGEVQIDLEANPAGLTSPDQAPPRELKNPIHLKTSGLTFNKNSGDARTEAKVEFGVPEASGSAMGARYVAKNNTLTLESQVHVLLAGPAAATVDATHATITKQTRQVVLEQPRLVHGDEQFDARQATLFLGEDNSVERVVAADDVRGTVEAGSPLSGRADQVEIFLSGGSRNRLRQAVVSGGVHAESSGNQPASADAGRVTLDFAGRNLLGKVRAEQDVRVVLSHAAGAESTSSVQDVVVTAPVVDFFVEKGRWLERAETSGAAQIDILAARQGLGQGSGSGSAAGSSVGGRTVVTAGRFEAKFDDHSQLVALHGTPDARIVNVNPGQPDRVSTSDTLDVAFLPKGGIESITQQGNLAYSDGQSQAWAERARYTPADQMLVLTGSPRVIDRGMATTAQTMRINRETGDAFADGDVRTTYSEMKEQPDGALLASASPIHVTASHMSVRQSPAKALYSGNARLWQDANMVQAPTIQFDRDRRSVVAQGTASQPVSTVVVQIDKSGKGMPVTITSTRLTYTDAERRARCEGGVSARSADFTASARSMDVYLVARSQTASNQSVAGQSQLDRLVAEGSVQIQQPHRQATGDKLVYSAAADKFVLTGGPPSIFDAERGKITGVSLTFFRRDDRVLVEGEASSPVVTQTRVAR